MPDSGSGPRHGAEPSGSGVSTELDVPGRRTARGTAEVTRLVQRFTESRSTDGPGGAPWRRRVGRLAAALATSARDAGTRAVAGGRWLTDLVVEIAPALTIRDAATLRAEHGGSTGDELADALVRSASRATAAVGAAGGALAAVELAAPPTLLGAPVQLTAETLLVIAIELRLIGELHEVYGQPVGGSPRQRAVALLTAWARRRGVDPFSGSLGGALGFAARRELRGRVMRRLGRNVTTLAPFLAGALAGAEVNRRETVSLAQRVLADLRRSPR